jgi:hypothetical protein
MRATGERGRGCEGVGVKGIKVEGLHIGFEEKAECALNEYFCS